RPVIGAFVFCAADRSAPAWRCVPAHRAHGVRSLADRAGPPVNNNKPRGIRMAPVSPWRQLRPVAGIRAEALFGDRVVPCFPDRPANLDEMLRRSVARFGEREALVFQQERFTYRRFDALVERVAAGMLAQGLRPGERIGVYMGNSAALMAVIFGALRAGLIVVPMGIRLQAAELDYILNDCTAAALAFDADTA